MNAWDVTVDDVLTTSGKYRKRAIDFPPTPEMMINAARLARALSSVSLSTHRDLVLTSGYRPTPINRKVGGAPNSWHIHCAAADVADPKWELAKWVRAEEAFCAHLGLWMEDPRDTPGWVHFQIYPPASHTRFFRPRGAIITKLPGGK